MISPPPRILRLGGLERIQNAIRERCESNKTSDVENAAISLNTSHNIIVEHTHRRNHHVLVAVKTNDGFAVLHQKPYF